MAAVWCQLRLQGPRTYHCADVSKQKIILGRSAKCDVVVTEPTVSLKHLTLTRLPDGRVFITDEPESTGTFVKPSHGHRFKKVSSNQGHELSDGDFVAFGISKEVFFCLDMSKSKEKQQASSEVPLRPNRKRELSSTSSKKPVSVVDISSDESVKDVPTTSTAEPKRRSRAGSLKTTSELAPKSSETPVVAPKVPDDSSFLQEFLTCHICQCLFYEPVNIAPCNHVFCGGCLSPWLKTSKNCPTCRTKIERAGLHHILKNIILEYIKRHPEAERSLDDRQALDKQDTITKPKPKPRRRNQAQQNNSNASSNNRPPGMPDPLLHMVFSMLNNGASAPAFTINTLARFHDDDDEITFGDPDDPMMIPDTDSDEEDEEDDEEQEGHAHHHHHQDNCRIS